MKHLVIDARILGTSTGRYIDELLRHLKPLAKEIKITIIVRSETVEKFEIAKSPYHIVISDYKMYSLSSQIILAWKLYRLRADLVHFAFQFTPLLYRRPYIITIHDLTQLRFKNSKGSNFLYTTKQNLLKFAIKSSAMRAKHIITPTKYVADDVSAFFKISRKKISVTYESGDIYHGKKITPIKELASKDYIFCVGTAHAHKNLYRLISAFQLIQKDHENLHLVFAGKNDIFYERLKQFVDESNISNVHFLGYISDEQLNWLYKNGLSYIFPSMSEGFGLPGLEAMSHQCPVISSDATCLPEVYSDAAVYFNAYDIIHMAKVISETIYNEQLKKLLVSNGNQLIKKYSWKKMATETEQIYRKFIN